jgi:hypothetical protein
MVDPDSRHHLFERALHRADWTIHQAWLQTIAAGGTSSVFDLEAFLHGLGPLVPAQQDVLAHVLNERLADLYESAKVAYLASPPVPTVAGEDPLTVLDDLLAAHRRARSSEDQ